MDYTKLFPGRFLKSVDFDGKDVTLTIKSVKSEEIDDKTKAIVKFAETKRELVLNRTNAESLVLCFGRDVNAWVGKRVTWYPAIIKDPFGEGEISAIRVRGSPDITKPASATIQRGRKTLRVAVQPTGKAAPKSNGKPTPPPAPQPPQNGELSEEEKQAAIRAEYEAAGEPLPEGIA